MADWGGKVAAWFASVAAVSAGLAALLAQTTSAPLGGDKHNLFIALVIVAAGSFAALLFTGPRALWMAWRNRGHINPRSAGPALPDTPASKTAADEAARELVRIEQNREYDRMRPVLEGHIVPWPGRSDGRNHRLEIRVKTPWPLALILLNVPGDAWFSASVHPPPVGMDFLIQFPEPGKRSAPFRPGHPASCPVRVAASVRSTVTAFAKCRNEYHVWEDVEITITLDGTIPYATTDSEQGATEPTPEPGPAQESLPAGLPIVLRGGPANGREVLHSSHPDDYVRVVGRVRHAWRHTDPQALAPPDRTRPVYDYMGPVE
jgi:hypothetical protein